MGIFADDLQVFHTRIITVSVRLFTKFAVTVFAVTVLVFTVLVFTVLMVTVFVFIKLVFTQLFELCFTFSPVAIRIVVLVVSPEFLVFRNASDPLDGRKGFRFLMVEIGGPWSASIRGRVVMPINF